jgi:Na+-driven multidrug efflux pump
MLGAALATIAAYAVSLLLVFGKSLQIKPMPWISAIGGRRKAC